MQKERKRFLRKLTGGILAAAVTFAAFPSILFTKDSNTAYAQNTDTANIYTQKINNAQEQIKSDGDYDYCEQDDGTIVITGYKGTDTKVEVPEKIADKKVVSISAAFYHCKSISEIKLPDTISEIKRSTFEGCSSLTNINIPEKVTYIGSQAFMNCSSLQQINIPESVESMKYYIFRGCSSLTDIQVAEGNKAYASIDGVLYNKEKTSLIKYPEGKQGTYSVFEETEKIEEDAFENCDYLTEVTIPANIDYLNGNMFRNCTNLAEIKVSEANKKYSSRDGILYNKEQTFLIRCPEGKTGAYKIPEGVTEMTSSSFRNCSNLIKISIPESIETLGFTPFLGCSSLIEIQVAKENLKYSSENGALYNKTKTELICCPNSKNGTFIVPEGVEIISSEAFYECSSLEKLNIPASVKTIYAGAFDACSSLTDIEVSDENSSYSTADGVLYNKEKTELIHCMNGKQGNCIIPDGVEEIDGEAFNDCHSLAKIEIPASVKYIKAWFIRGCDSLTEIQVSEKNQKYASLDGVLYNKDKTQLCNYPGGKEGFYAIPEGVLSIGHAAFLNCGKVTEVQIPESIQCIDYGAFTGCHNTIIIGVKDSEAERYAREYNMPFRYIHTISSDDNISVSYNSERDTNGYLLYSKLLSEADIEYQKINLEGKIAEENVSPKDVIFSAYNIILTDESQIPVESERTVTVKIPVPEGYQGERCKIYYVKDNGNMENMGAEYKDNYLTFQTDHFSTYLITETELLENSIIYGDINGDGDINSKDAVLLKKHLAGYESLTFDEIAADVNGDGDIDTKDAVRLLRHLAGYDVTLGK